MKHFNEDFIFENLEIDNKSIEAIKVKKISDKLIINSQPPPKVSFIQFINQKKQQ